MKKNKQNNFGFTLIEMMIVIAIIGILAGAIVLNNQKAVDKAIDAKVRIFANSIPVTLAGSYVAQWKFDELSTAKEGAIIRDSWGSNNCTLYTGSDGLEKISSNCVDGNCISFDGSNDYLNCGNDESLRITTNLTVEAWAKRNGSTNDILGKWSNNNGRGWGISMGENKFRIGFRKADGSYWGGYGNTTIKDNTWYHLAFVYVGDGSIPKMWVNGNNEVVSIWISNGDALHGFSDSGENLDIGRSHIFAGSIKYFSGAIDGVRIYNQALSAEKIQENYLAGLKELLAKGKISQAEYAAQLDEFNKNLVQK